MRYNGGFQAWLQRRHDDASAPLSWRNNAVVKIYSLFLLFAHLFISSLCRIFTKCFLGHISKNITTT